MSESDKVTLGLARHLREDFLQQNAFSAYDQYCPFYKTIWMLRNILTFYDLAQQAVQSSNIKWDSISKTMEDVVVKLQGMKSLEPSSGEEKIVAHMQALNKEIASRFLDLTK